MKNLAKKISFIYGFIAACFFCYFMVSGEINAKKECINKSGYFIGILWGCDSFNPYQSMGGRWGSYVYSSITWPSILFEK